MSNRIAAVPPSYLARAMYPKVTVAEYEQMIRDGVLGEGDPVELLEGYLVQKMSRNEPHETSLRRLINRLPRRVPTGWSVAFQCAIALAESRPEPDGAVLRGEDSDHDGTIPAPAVIGLLIEVADTNLSFDRVDKGRLYASERIPAYWVLNVPDRRVEVYTNPDPVADPPAYRNRTDFTPGQDVPLVLDGVEVSRVPVSELIP